MHASKWFEQYVLKGLGLNKFILWKENNFTINISFQDFRRTLAEAWKIPMKKKLVKDSHLVLSYLEVWTTNKNFPEEKNNLLFLPLNITTFSHAGFINHQCRDVIINSWPICLISEWVNEYLSQLFKLWMVERVSVVSV